MQTSLETAGNGHAEPAAPEADAFPRTLDFELNPSVQFGNQTFSSIHLEEPTFKMIRIAETELLTNPGGAQTVQSVRAYHMAALSQVSKIPRQALEDMRISEFDRAIAFLAPYLLDGRATGQT